MPTTSKPEEQDARDCVVEVDCPWFDSVWLLDHPDFPLAASAAERTTNERE